MADRDRVRPPRRPDPPLLEQRLFFGERDGGDQGPRHVDYMWPMWAMFDRTPAGRGDFQHELDYR